MNQKLTIRLCALFMVPALLLIMPLLCYGQSRLGGLAEGLSQGLESGTRMRMQEEQLELQKQQMELERQRMETEIEMRKLQNEQLRQQLQREAPMGKTSSAAPIQWTYYAKDLKGSMFYYDPASFSVIARRYISVREQVLFGSDNPSNVAYVVRSTTVDCEAKNIKFNDADILYNNGQTTHLPNVRDWQPVPARSVAASLVDKMCGRVNQGN